MGGGEKTEIFKKRSESDLSRFAGSGRDFFGRIFFWATPPPPRLQLFRRWSSGFGVCPAVSAVGQSFFRRIVTQYPPISVNNFPRHRFAYSIQTCLGPSRECYDLPRSPELASEGWKPGQGPDLVLEPLSHGW